MAAATPWPLAFAAYSPPITGGGEHNAGGRCAVSAGGRGSHRYFILRFDLVFRGQRQSRENQNRNAELQERSIATFAFSIRRAPG